MYNLHTPYAEMTTLTPKWAEGLTRNGKYYEGMVDDAERYLQLHATSTIITYGTRTSWKAAVPFFQDENVNDKEKVSNYCKLLNRLPCFKHNQATN